MGCQKFRYQHFQQVVYENNKGYNLSEIEVKNETSSGGNPTDATLTKQRSAVAKPANPAHQYLIIDPIRRIVKR
ncbi:MAG: hypothetical protein Ta2G_00950 [Termitinemataceae bacterium]|nr:MAG: hypothetical protein Ta2G_00950 [Termitinemataceae bacterium]